MIMVESSPFYYQQSGVIPYRIKNNQIEVLLITNRRGKRWIIPKGIIEPDLTPQDSAAKEAYEEAGVRGTVFPDLLGTYTYEKWGGVCTVKVYLLKVEALYADWLESYFRQRQWFSLEEAITAIEHPTIKDILNNLSQQI